MSTDTHRRIYVLLDADGNELDCRQATGDKVLEWNWKLAKSGSKNHWTRPASGSHGKRHKEK